jgi:site-specific recombinase XerD
MTSWNSSSKPPKKSPSIILKDPESPVVPNRRAIKQKLRNKQPVHLLYQWMKRRSLSPAKLSFEDLQRFFQQQSLKRSQRQKILFPYLKLVSSDFPQLLFPGYVPPLAQEFIGSLRTSLKSSTCRNYVASLHRFHNFLVQKNIKIEGLTRKHTAEFFTTLVDAGLAPITRHQFTIKVRVYLRWLHEREIIQAQPQDLVRATDFPKLPTYLPRPLPAEIDRELQKRLRASNSIYHKGLLLMRHTGIRIGELVALPCDCVYTDSRQINFLRVPLGKLDNERNVPLDKKTYSLINKIRRMEPRKRLHLMPRNNRSALAQRDHMIRDFQQIAAGIKTDAPITSHRLRHTYATCLLNAGVTLPGVMKLLGHRDYRMTLRYAGVTQESVLRDYFAAIKTLDYASPLPTTDVATLSKSDPVALLDETERLLKKLAADNQLPAAENTAILRKLARLKVGVRQALRRHHETAKLAG